MISTQNGTTTLYGVSSAGVTLDGDKSTVCLNSISIYGRISEPSILKWIKSEIGKSD